LCRTSLVGARVSCAQLEGADCEGVILSDEADSLADTTRSNEVEAVDSSLHRAHWDAR